MWLTSQTGRTSSCTGSGSRTYPRSGAGSRRSASRRPRRAGTPRGSCSAVRSRASRPTRSSTRSAQLAELSDLIVGDPAYSNLPRKYKTSVSGCGRHCTNHEINDVSFVGVIGPDGTPGYDLWVGGGLSTNPRFAVRLDAFVPAERLIETWRGVTSVFRDYGYRKSRNRARLKFLMADWGRRSSARCSSRSTSTHHCRTARRRRHRRAPATTSASTGSVTAATRRVRAAVRTNQRHAALPASPNWPQEYGGGRIHTTTQQQLVILGRAGGQRRGSCRRPRRRRSGRPAERVPPRHDRLHGHRVLQAGARGDQGPGQLAGRRARAPACPTSTRR